MNDEEKDNIDPFAKLDDLQFVKDLDKIPPQYFNVIRTNPGFAELYLAGKDTLNLAVKTRLEQFLVSYHQLLQELRAHPGDPKWTSTVAEARKLVGAAAAIAEKLEESTYCQDIDARMARALTAIRTAILRPKTLPEWEQFRADMIEMIDAYSDPTD